jgi:predicted MFS family arabinose efflux permease
MAALIALCAAAFVAQVNFFAFAPFSGEMAPDLQTSVPLLGQLTTLLLLGSASLGLIVGPLADRVGYRRLLVLGLLAIGGNLLGASVAPSYTVLLMLTCLGALGDALVFGLTFTLAAVVFAGDARRKAISWTMASLGGGAILGVPILTTISGNASWRVALACGGVAAVAAAGMARVLLPAPQPSSPHQVTTFRWRDLGAAYVPLLIDRAMLKLLGLTLSRALWFLAAVTYMGAYARGELGLSTQLVGLYYLLAGVGATAGNFIAAGRLSPCGTRPGMAFVNLCGGAAAGLCLVSGARPLVPLLITAAVLSGMATVGIATALADESRAGTGTTMALNAALMNAGGAGGAAIGGALLAVGGYSALAMSLPLVATLGTVAMLLPGARPRPTYGVS